MDQITSVSDIPLPGEDITDKQQDVYSVHSELNIQSEHNVSLNTQSAEYVKQIENVYEQHSSVDSYTPNMNYSTTTTTQIIIDPQTVSQSHHSIPISSHSNSVQLSDNLSSNMSNIDTAVQILQETIMEVDQSILDQSTESTALVVPQEIISSEVDQSIRSTALDAVPQDVSDVSPSKQQELLSNSFHNLQKFVEQSTQEAITESTGSSEMLDISSDLENKNNSLADLSAENKLIEGINLSTDSSNTIETELVDFPIEGTLDVSGNNLEGLKNVSTDSEAVLTIQEETESNMPVLEIAQENTANIDYVASAVASENITETVHETDQIVEPIVVENVETVLQDVKKSIEISQHEITIVKPARKNSRTNSLIQSIENEWTIEEIKDEADDDDEIKEDDEILQEDVIEPVVGEPVVGEPVVGEPVDEPVCQPAEDAVAVKHEIVSLTEVPDDVVEEEEQLVPVIEEPKSEVDEQQEKTQEGNTATTEVILLDNINEAIGLNLDHNVTIEIIDEVKQDEVNEPLMDVEIKTEAIDENDQKAKKSREQLKKPRMPSHLQGRTVDHPTEDVNTNGRTAPKARLGVKVPYRFLSSQMLSKDEIAKEFYEIQSKRVQDTEPPAGGDIFFATKLTQRLASKICPKDSNKSNIKNVEKLKEKLPPKLRIQKEELTSGIPEDALLTPPSSQTSSTTVASTSKDNESIADNSDLLAILEGNVDVDLIKEVKKSSIAASNNKPPDNVTKIYKSKIPSTVVNKLDPETEREIALKQLRSFPLQKKSSPRGFPRGGKKTGRSYYYSGGSPGIRNVTKSFESVIDKKPHVEKIKEKFTLSSKFALPSKTTSLSKSSPAKEIKHVKEVEKEEKSPKKPEVPLDERTKEKIQKAAVNILEKVKENKLSLHKKDDPSEDLSDDVLVESLTPKMVSKTYSRKESVVNVSVPADLEQIVNDQEQQSALESMEDEPADVHNKEEKQKVTESGKSPLKKIKRSTDYQSEIPLVSKRARIIKRKVIWDPAESSTPSRALLKKLALLTPVKPTTASSSSSTPTAPSSSTPTTALPAPTSTENIIASPPAARPRGRPRKYPIKVEIKSEPMDVEEEDEKASTSSIADIVTEPAASKIRKAIMLAKVQKAKMLLKKRHLRSITGKMIRSTNGELKSSLALSKKKTQLVAELARKVTAKKLRDKPKKTELDKLLSDEGAVNMLYSVRQDTKVGRPLKRLIPSKDLKNRTKALREVIQQTSTQDDSPKALRKKETPILIPLDISAMPRKKSRDSIRSSIQSPPPSPSFMMSNRAEASRIIRRHSSSFSSDCSSPRRLSIDLQNVEAVVPVDKPEEKEETGKTEFVDFTSPVRTLRRKGVPIFERKTEEKTYKGKKKLTSETGSNSPVSDRLANQKTDKLDKSEKADKSEKEDKSGKAAEKISVSEKRKISSEMSKNFSKSPVPKRRTRNSKTEEDLKEVIIVDDASDSKSADKEQITEKKKAQRTRHVSVSTNYKEISLRKMDTLVQIILTPTCTKLQNSMNLQMFQELVDLLKQLEKDESCRAVLITSSDSSFCHGVNFSMLIHSNAEKRLAVAQETAAGLKKFLKTLANFPKPIIAGVHGSAVGLGVTMLPLFDLVFASDKATFSTPYGRLGQVPDGVAFLTLPGLLGSTLTSEMIFANRKLTASEASQHGLVTRTLWPDKFHEELVSNAVTISKNSNQCMTTTKSLLRQSLLSKLDEALATEEKLLVQHWTSNECQENFRKLLKEEEWW